MKIRSLCLIALTAFSLHAYVRSTSTNIITTGNPFFWPNPGSLKFAAHQDLKAGITNSQGNPIITADSDPKAALQAALDAWSGIDSSTIRFGALQSTTSLNNPNDNANTFVFSDTPDIRSALGDALGFTLVSFQADGRLLDADILFNPARVVGGVPAPFSTTGADGTFDLASVALHELGHALGANHSGVLAASMFQSLPTGTTVKRKLSADDIAFAVDAYPAAGSSSRFGSITGKITLPGGGPARIAHVAAIDPATGTIVGMYSNSGDGAYRINGLPPGKYIVFAEPLDGPVLPGNVYLPDSQVDAAFATTFSGGIDNPTLFDVAGGGATAVDIAVGAGPPPFNIRRFGTFAVGSQPVPVDSGKTVGVTVQTDGIQTADGVTIRVFGPGFRFKDGSLRVDPGFGPGYLRFDLDVLGASGSGTIAVIKNGAVSVATAALLIAPPPAPAFTNAGIANAASFKPGDAAPGAIYSLFGTNLASSSQEATSIPLPTTLAGVTVRIQDAGGVTRNCPLFFVSAGQINFQIPPETPLGQATVSVVRSDGATGTATITIAAVNPGLFSINASGQGVAAAQALTVRGDGSQVTDPVFQAGSGAFIAAPITITAQGSQVYLLLYGTGIRGFKDLVTATLGGVAVPVIGAAAQGQFVGLDQVNIGPIPASLAGRGEVSLILAVDGKTANTVTVSIR